MKVALIHDYIKEYGGAERVLEALHEIFPKAPVYTSVYLPSFLGPHRERFRKWNIKPSILQKVPFKAKLISPFRLIAPFVFSQMDFSNYDLVIVSATGAYNPNLIKKGKATHVCYYHTPPRYLYGYPTARNFKKYALINGLAHVVNHILRMVDYKSAQNPDLIVANSNEVASRIRRFYGREATVIYPPVNIPRKISKVKKGDYYLTGGRLARAKRVDIAVKAATKLGIPLKVFGKDFAGYKKELEKIAGQNIEFVGEVTDSQKYELMSQAKAFLFPSEHEDFGITPVESMSVGTPVIALRSGGVQESVVEGKTGVFFDKPTAKSMIKAIKKFERIKLKPIDCRNQAQKFSSERFNKEMKKYILSHARTS